MIGKKAFTLAEVLITLSILGIVAVITIPNIIRKIQDRQQITALKKSVSIIDNAIQLAVIENGSYANWNWPNPTNAWDYGNFDYFAKTLMSYMNVKKYCNRDYNCIPFTSTRYKRLNGVLPTSGAGIMNAFGGCTILKNDIMFCYQPIHHHTGCSNSQAPIGEYLGKVLVDINAGKGPNRYGYDVFELLVGNKGVILSQYGGCPMDIGWYANTKRSSDCLTPQSLGTTCSAYVLKFNNMNYKYHDISSSEW